MLLMSARGEFQTWGVVGQMAPLPVVLSQWQCGVDQNGWGREDVNGLKNVKKKYLI